MLSDNSIILGRMSLDISVFTAMNRYANLIRTREWISSWAMVMLCYISLYETKNWLSNRNQIFHPRLQPLYQNIWNDFINHKTKADRSHVRIILRFEILKLDIDEYNSTHGMKPELKKAWTSITIFFSPTLTRIFERSPWLQMPKLLYLNESSPEKKLLHAYRENIYHREEGWKS